MHFLYRLYFRTVQYAGPTGGAQFANWAVSLILLGVLGWAVIHSKAPAPSMTSPEVKPAPVLACNLAPAIPKSSKNKSKKRQVNK